MNCDLVWTNTVIVIVVTLIIITLSSLLLTAISLSQAQTEFLTYENKDFGFSIRYPSDWKKEEEYTSKSSNVNIVVSFAKQNGSRINTEADLYIELKILLAKTSL